MTTITLQRQVSVGRFSQLRLRRLARTAAIGMLLIAAWSFFGSQSATATDASGGGAQVSFSYITVGEGDSLWQLAQQYAAGRDHQQFIADLVRLNGLTDSALIPGQRLALP